MKFSLLLFIATLLPAQEVWLPSLDNETFKTENHLAVPSERTPHKADSVSVKGFTLTAAPSKLSIPSGTSGIMVISQTNPAFTGTLSYEVLNLTGATCAISMSGNTAFITISVPFTTSLGTRFAILQGTSNGLIQQITISIVVTDKPKLTSPTNTGAISVSSVAAVGQTINLSQLGSSDWFTTGRTTSQDDPKCPYYGPCATIRKLGGSGLVAATITSGTGDGWFYPYPSNAVNLTWADGAGTLPPNSTGSHINNTSVQLQAFAGTGPRTLTIVAGLYGPGTLTTTCHLTDGTTPDSTTVQTISGVDIRVFTIQFNAASSGHQLVVTFSHQGGEILLYGAALAGGLAPQIHYLQTTDNLNAFIGAVTGGDTLVLPDTYKFVGHVILPVRGDNGWVEIRSNTTLLAGQRARPGDLSAAIVSPDEQPAIQNDYGSTDHKKRPARGWRFTGIEVTANNTKAYLNYGLISLGFGDNPTISDIPSDITFQRCYIHGDGNSNYIKGIIGNANNLSVLDSYLSGFVSSFMEANAINVYSSAGPLRIVNNYLEASAENVMIGGSGPDVGPALVPTNGLIQHNYFYKPMAWRGSAFIVKNLLEFKDGYNFVVDSNLFENCWAANQNGMALLLTPRTGQGGTAANHVDTITFSNNILRHSGSAMNLGIYDDQAVDSAGHKIPPAQLQWVHDVKLINNLFDDLSTAYAPMSHGVQIFGPPNNLVLDHNTFNFGENTNDHGWWLANDTGESPSNASVTNNDFGADLYGDSRGPTAAVLVNATFKFNNIRGGASTWKATPAFGTTNTLLPTAPIGVGADVSGLLLRESSVRSGNRN